MADINERVIVDTDQAQTNLKDLKEDTGTADKALDELKETAGKVDQEKVDIPVELTGAKEAAADLGEVDKKARAAGDGAKIGVSGISDMTGPFGDAAGKAGEMGQAIEGAGQMIEGMAGKIGLSEDATKKLMGVIGGVAAGVAIAVAAWDIYNTSQKDAKKGADEVRDALGSVYQKLKEGDAQAAATTFVDTMGDKIENFRKLIGGSVSKADIAGAIFGDPASIANVETAIGDLDGTTRALADVGLKTLKGAWGTAKTAMDENIALETKVQGFFGVVTKAADDTVEAVDRVTTSYGNMSMATPTAAPFGGNASGSGFGGYWPGGAPSQTVNIYPPANTPIAVDQATRRNAQIQGPR